MFKSFVIRQKNEPFSESLSDELIASAKAFNIEVEKFDGLFDRDVDNFISDQKLKPFTLNGKKTNQTDTIGKRGCFSSHFALWKLCILENCPYIIFENDAVLIRNIDQTYINQFDDILHLDPYSRDPYAHTKDLKNRFRRDRQSYETLLYSNSEVEVKKFEGYGSFHLKNIDGIKRGFIRGSHAYIIKPKGAKKLIDAVYKFGFLSADTQMNLNFINVYATYPSLARINPFFCNEDHFKKHSTVSGVSNA